jgi:hypothetical protein
MSKDQIYPSKGNPDREPDKEGSTEYTGGPMNVPLSWVDFHRSNPQNQSDARNRNAAHIGSMRSPLSEDLNMKNARNPAFANPPSAENAREIIEGLSPQYKSPGEKFEQDNGEQLDYDEEDD